MATPNDLPIIGLDFGNYYSQVCCVDNMDPETRRGGLYLNLLDPTSPNPNGIPSAFFYSSRRGGGKPLFGREAEVARPISNCVRYMKRHLGENKTLDGKSFSYDEMITKTVEHIIRQANIQLHKETQKNTHLVSLAYPASFLSSQRARLVELVEKATLADGTHIKVCGTIQEPAAAALDYLAEHPGRNQRTVVLAYDLGAGTFDASIVEAFPNGQKTASGHTFYYDVHSTDGIADLGGAEFDQLMYNLIVQKAGFKPEGSHADTIRATAEIAKRELTTAQEVYPDVIDPKTGDFCDIVITRREFETKARPLVKKTVEMVRHMITSNPAYKPDLILLTGGASQMPIVRTMMEEAFPEYQGRITSHRPSRAIAYGAARYGTVEPDIDVGSRRSTPVRQRTTFDIGVRYAEAMNQLFAVDEGLKSRFGTRDSIIRFEDYNAPELSQILNVMAAKADKMSEIRAFGPLELTEGYREQSAEVFRWITGRKDPNFGNARFVRTYLHDSVECLLARLDDGRPQIPPEELCRLTEADIPVQFRKVLSAIEVPAIVSPDRLNTQRFGTVYRDNYDSCCTEMARSTVLLECLRNGQRVGTGSGAIISPDGHILTCAHVVNKGDEFRAKVYCPGSIGGDYRWFDCRLLQPVHNDCDMAMLKMEGRNFPAIPMRRAQEPILETEGTILMGYPLGGMLNNGNLDILRVNNFAGRISSVQDAHRGSSVIRRFYVDTTGLHGNSGSPVISQEDGRMIGVFSGSVRPGEESLDELNYCYPIHYFWQRFVSTPRPGEEA